MAFSSFRIASMSTDSSHRIIPVKRRNGKLQSCEPCRKRKLSCDHRLPSCGRCVRRGTSDACYYHPAPLTKGVSSPTTTASSPVSLSPQVIDKPLPVQHARQPPLSKDDNVHGNEQRLYGILSVASAGILMESLTPKVGFLGVSSSSAVVAELNSSLGIAVTEESDHGMTDNSRIPEAIAREGAQVLRFFQDFPKIRELLERKFASGSLRTMFRPIYKTWLDGTADFMAELLMDRRADKFERHALTVCRNTQQPVRSHGTMSAEEWALQATGKSSRWETLGLLLATMGIKCADLPSWDPVFRSSNQSFQKRKLMKKTMELTRTCIELSRKCGSRNDAFACMHYEYLCLVTTTLGDTSIEAWSGLSEVCDTMTLMGLHLEQRMDDQTPFFLCELRLRLFNFVFSLDKFCSTFLGRPPHLSYRYSVIQDMSDLTDEEICDTPEALHASLTRLNGGNGWTGSGPPHIATWRKAWVKRHVIREDILEVVIGPHPIDLDARISDIRIRERQALESMPSFVRIDPEELLTNIKRDPSYLIPGRGTSWRPYDVQCFLSIHAAIQHSDFLLERVLVNKQKAPSGPLVTAARRLLSMVLKTHGMRDFFRECPDDTDILAFYGVPPAGVLAMEMLRRDQIQDPYDDFPRSETLQQLSVFVTALENVDPADGNYAICSMGLNAIRKVLDRLMSKPSGPAPFNTDFLLDNGQFGANMGNDADFLQWLGSVDFDAAALLDTAPQVFSESIDFPLQAASV